MHNFFYHLASALILHYHPVHRVYRNTCCLILLSWELFFIIYGPCWWQTYESGEYTGCVYWWLPNNCGVEILGREQRGWMWQSLAWKYPGKRLKFVKGKRSAYLLCYDFTRSVLWGQKCAKLIFAQDSHSLGLHPRPHWGSFEYSPDPLVISVILLCLTPASFRSWCLWHFDFFAHWIIFCCCLHV